METFVVDSHPHLQVRVKSPIRHAPGESIASSLILGDKRKCLGRGLGSGGNEWRGMEREIDAVAV